MKIPSDAVVSLPGGVPAHFVPRVRTPAYQVVRADSSGEFIAASTRAAAGEGGRMWRRARKNVPNGTGRVPNGTQISRSRGPAAVQPVIFPVSRVGLCLAKHSRHEKLQPKGWICFLCTTSLFLFMRCSSCQRTSPAWRWTMPASEPMIPAAQFNRSKRRRLDGVIIKTDGGTRYNYYATCQDEALFVRRLPGQRRRQPHRLRLSRLPGPATQHRAAP